MRINTERNKKRLISACWFLSVCCLIALCGYASPESESDPPNVLFIFADDLGYGDVSIYDPAQKIKTPNIDMLASQGIRFTDAHTASGVCTPSRYSLLTGRYSWRTGLKRGVLGGFSQPLIEENRMTLGDLFKSEGYATACIGKWHLGMNWSKPDRGDQEYAMRNDASGVDFKKPIKRSPTSNGFDYYFGISASLDMPPYVFIENDRVTELPTSTLKKEDDGGRVGPAVPGWRHKFVLPTLFDRAIDFIEKNRKEKFFIYLPLNAPHTPHAPGDTFVDKSGLDIYGDFVVEIDYHIGRILKALRQNDLEQDTLVIVTSDNGPEVNMFPRRKETGHDSSSRFLGAKRDNWEGGHRVPFIARWPGRIKPGSSSGVPFSLVDMMATFANLLKVDLPEDQAVDSVSILPSLFGKSSSNRNGHAIIHHSSQGEFGIRLGDWKLLFHEGSGGNNYSRDRFDNTIEQDSAKTEIYQLYNLEIDPGETRNLVSDHPDKLKEVKALAIRYIKNGRSTPGPVQEYVKGDWPQINWTEKNED